VLKEQSEGLLVSVPEETVVEIGRLVSGNVFPAVDAQHSLSNGGQAAIGETGRKPPPARVQQIDVQAKGQGGQAVKAKARPDKGFIKGLSVVRNADASPFKILRCLPQDRAFLFKTFSDVLANFPMSGAGIGHADEKDGEHLSEARRLDIDDHPLPARKEGKQLQIARSKVDESPGVAPGQSRPDPRRAGAKPGVPRQVNQRLVASVFQLLKSVGTHSPDKIEAAVQRDLVLRQTSQRSKGKP